MLGLAVGAVFAMNAMIASAAQAGTFDYRAGEYPAIITAAQIGEHTFEVDTVDPNNDAVKCKDSTFTGALSEAEANEGVVRVTPTYTECKAFGLTATVTTTGCTYTIRPTATITAPHEFTGLVDLHCESGKFIKVTTATCEIQVTEQTNLAHVILTNDTAVAPAKDDVTLTADVTGIAYHVTKDGIGCPLTGVETRVDGVYKGETTVTAENEASSQVNFTVIHT